MGDGLRQFNGVPRLVKALMVADLDRHVVDIRKSLAAGESQDSIARRLDVTLGRLGYYVRRMKMARGRRRGLRIPHFPGTESITAENYRPKQRGPK